MSKRVSGRSWNTKEQTKETEDGGSADLSRAWPFEK